MLDMLKERKAALEAQGKKGFTLMEMLIVIAIIAVLIAIAIPVFTAQLERAGEATDASNIRGAYAEVMAQALTSQKASYSKTGSLQQGQENWQNTEFESGLKQLETSGNGMSVTYSGNPTAGGTYTVSYNGSGLVAITVS